MFVGGAMWWSAGLFHNIVRQRAIAAARQLNGNSEITSQIVDGRDLTPTSDRARWRLLTARGEAIALRFEDDTRLWCDATTDQAARTLKLTCTAVPRIS